MSVSSPCRSMAHRKTSAETRVPAPWRWCPYRRGPPAPASPPSRARHDPSGEDRRRCATGAPILISRPGPRAVLQRQHDGGFLSLRPEVHRPCRHARINEVKGVNRVVYNGREKVHPRTGRLAVQSAIQREPALHIFVAVPCSREAILAGPVQRQDVRQRFARPALGSPRPRWRLRSAVPHEHDPSTAFHGSIDRPPQRRPKTACVPLFTLCLQSASGCNGPSARPD